MVKKVKEFKSGDFIFAKVKGYPAWPARVQRPNGKKYFIYFYGTGETANLAPNVIFDYAENKDKFLNKSIKRKDFNDGVAQIEYDFANNVSIEDVLGGPVDPPPDTSVANESAMDASVDDSAGDTTADTTANETGEDFGGITATIETGAPDSDDGALVIDEGKKAKKPGAVKAAVTPKTPKAVRAPKVKKDEATPAPGVEEEKEEIVSRSGRKIRPKRYVDEQTEENATLPSPAPKKRRASGSEKEKADKLKGDAAQEDKSKNYVALSRAELEDIKSCSAVETDKEAILIACLPSGQYVGVKLFQSVPTSFKSDASKLSWYKQAALNALTLQGQLEKGHITPQSVSAQLETDLNLTDEEKSNLDKEREIEEKKLRVQFLKAEMKLIELDAKIKSCLSLEKADTELCLKLIDELMELDIKSLMLLKHPGCVETVKRMRVYVGNTPSWELSDAEAATFSKQAHAIRKRADKAYTRCKELFDAPDGLSFWEYFSDRVLQFKKCTAKLTPDELLEMVNEPKELSAPSAHTMKAAIDAANNKKVDLEETTTTKRTPAKNKKAPTPSPASTPTKKQRGKQANKASEEKKAEVETDANKDDAFNSAVDNFDKGSNKEAEKKPTKKQINKEKATKKKEANKKSEPTKEPEPNKETENKETENIVIENKEAEKQDTNDKEAENKDENNKEVDNKDDDNKDDDNKETDNKDKEVENKDTEGSSMDVDTPQEEVVAEKPEQNGGGDTEVNTETTTTTNDIAEGEPKAKRAKENPKKAEPAAPKTPTKKKSKS